MVEETSEASKDQQSESATGENNIETTRARARARVAKSAASENNTFRCTCRIRNLKNVLLCYKSNGQCQVCAIHFGMHLDSWEST